MAFIHDPSCECTLSQLDLFTVPPTQSVVNGAWTEFFPVSSITSDTAPIEFNINEGDEYLYMSSTILQVQAKIIIIPMLMEVTLRTKPLLGLSIYYYSPSFRRLMYILEWSSKVSHSCSTYGYRAILESILNYSKDATESQLASGLFFKDSAAKMNNCNPYSAGALVNYGLKKTRQSNSK